MEFEPLERRDEFENELRQALERRTAPSSLKRSLMARRRTQQQRNHTLLWRRLAASVALAAMLAAATQWVRHDREERRQGEAARRQLFTALRITNHALNHMNAQLAAHSRPEKD